MNQETLQQLGITKDEVLDRIVASVLREGLFDEGYETAKREIVKGYKEGIQKAIDQTISATCAEALNTVFQPVNTWGEKTGEPTTVRDMFLKSCQDWWVMKVDSKGNPTRDSYGIRETMVEHHARKAVSEAVNNAMKAELQTVVADAKAKMAAAIGAYISEHIVKRTTP
jgi:hypothetical protein